MTRDTRLTSIDGQPLTDPTKYRILVGQLIYLLNTRSNISYYVQQLSQHMSKPTDMHYNAAIRVLRYRKSSPAQGLFFPSNSCFQLKAFCYSDWATCPETRKSITWFCIYLGNSLISWKSKKQATVSRNSTEAEYISMASTFCELQWLLLFANIQFRQPVSFYCNNVSAIHIENNSSFHERTKHIELDCHIVREKLQQQLFQLLSVSSNQQLADMLTKPLDVSMFNSNISKLGLHYIYLNLMGY